MRPGLWGRGARSLTVANLRVSNPAPRPLPIGIAQPALEDLAGILARQMFEDFDVLWHLVAGKRGLELRTDDRDIELRPCTVTPAGIAPRSPCSLSAWPIRTDVPESFRT